MDQEGQVSQYLTKWANQRSQENKAGKPHGSGILQRLSKQGKSILTNHTNQRGQENRTCGPDGSGKLDKLS